MDRYAEYTFAFEPEIGIAQFYGTKVKAIQVTRIRYQHWQGGSASLAEIRAQSRSLVTDGMHVEVESQNGRHWFLRLRPAV